MKPVFFRQGHDFFPCFLFLKEAHFAGFHTHDNVVENRKAFHQFEVLMNHSDSKGVCVIRVVDFYLNAVFFDDTLLRLIQPEQDAHQCALACAVLTQKRMDLALFQLQGNIVIRNDAGELLGDVEHLNRILFQCRPTSFSALYFRFYCTTDIERIQTKKFFPI